MNDAMMLMAMGMSYIIVLAVSCAGRSRLGANTCTAHSDGTVEEQRRRDQQRARAGDRNDPSVCTGCAAVLC